MERNYEKQLLPAELCWLILNNLKQFDDKPQLIKDLLTKLNKIKDHPILGMFVDYFEEVYNNYFEKHNSFPDMAWLQANFKKSKPLKIMDDDFSMSIFEDFNKIVDYILLKQKLIETIVDTDDINVNTQNLLNVATELNKFADKSVEKPQMTKAGLKDMYKEYAKNYKGIKTYMQLLDDNIGVLGYKSLCTVVAPSGHGKSTFAISLAYNVAVYGGLCVDYLSFEVPKEHMWFNLYSMESNVLGINIESSKFKEAKLTEGEQQLADKCVDSLLNKIDKSGGYIDVHGTDDLEVDTFEGLCTKLESIAEKRGRKADLIVIDNIDNLQILKSSEKNEMTRVNNYIIELDSYCKRYYNNEGTTFLLLSQVNRPALKKLQNNEKSEGEKVEIDVSVIQKFNALYEKSTVCLCLYSDKKMASNRRANITPIKLRNRPLPLEPIKMSTNYAYSRFGGEVMPEDTSINDVEQVMEEVGNEFDEMLEEM